MYTTKYRLTKAGKLVCILLTLTLTGSAYFVVDRYWIDLSPVDVNHAPDRNAPAPSVSPAAAVLSGQAVSPPDHSAASLPENILQRSLASGPALQTSVYFDPQSSIVRSDSRQTLDQFIEAALAYQPSGGALSHTGSYLIVLEGNCATTLTGAISDTSRQEHLALSESRIASVQQYLIDQGGLAPDVFDLSFVNYGADNPSNDNTTFTRRAYNRRVDIYLYEHDSKSF